MPVIIERKDYDRWLDADEKSALPADLFVPKSQTKFTSGQSATA
jgi:putative SOS response-associated peptidase YedK